MALWNVFAPLTKQQEQEEEEPAVTATSSGIATSSTTTAIMAMAIEEQQQQQESDKQAKHGGFAGDDNNRDETTTGKGGGRSDNDSSSLTLSSPLFFPPPPPPQQQKQQKPQQPQQHLMKHSSSVEGVVAEALIMMMSLTTTTPMAVDPPQQLQQQEEEQAATTTSTTDIASDNNNNHDNNNIINNPSNDDDSINHGKSKSPKRCREEDGDDNDNDNNEHTTTRRSKKSKQQEQRQRLEDFFLKEPITREELVALTPSITRALEKVVGVGKNSNNNHNNNNTSWGGRNGRRSCRTGTGTLPGSPTRLQRNNRSKSLPSRKCKRLTITTTHSDTDTAPNVGSKCRNNYNNNNNNNNNSSNSTKEANEEVEEGVEQDVAAAYVSLSATVASATVANDAAVDDDAATVAAATVDASNDDPTTTTPMTTTEIATTTTTTPSTAAEVSTCQPPQQQQQQKVHSRASSSSSSLLLLRQNNPDDNTDDDAIMTARPYQVELADQAHRENLILHMGTGTGKTYVAVLLIQKYRYKRVAFVVPSVELALQHTATLRKHLSSSSCYSYCNNDSSMNQDEKKDVEEEEEERQQEQQFLVGLCAANKMEIGRGYPPDRQRRQQHARRTAGAATGNATATGTTTAASREDLSKCRVLVVTHGAFLDLLGSFRDMFSIEMFDLLILDECHNCVGDSNYAVLMREYYHAAKRKPRVLGLTASPLFDVDVVANDNNCKTDGGGDDYDNPQYHQHQASLHQRLLELEQVLDSRIITHDSSKSAEHVDVEYEETLDSLPLPELSETWTDTTCTTTGTTNESIDNNENNNDHLSSSEEAVTLPAFRVRELMQLESLYRDLGPFMTLQYARVLSKSLSIIPSNETKEQFLRVLKLLQRVVDHCEQKMADVNDLSAGRTDKLLALEEALDKLLSANNNENYSESNSGNIEKRVGIVFARRRITALALHFYFAQRQTSSTWINAAEIRQRWRETRMIDVENSEQEREANVGSWNTMIDVSNSEQEREANVCTTNACSSDAENNDDEDQFMDAEDDPFIVCNSSVCIDLPQQQTAWTNSAIATASDDADDMSCGQFDDAEDDPFVTTTNATTTATHPAPTLLQQLPPQTESKTCQAQQMPTQQQQTVTAPTTTTYTVVPTEPAGSMPTATLNGVPPHIVESPAVVLQYQGLPRPTLTPGAITGCSSQDDHHGYAEQKKNVATEGERADESSSTLVIKYKDPPPARGGGYGEESYSRDLIRSGVIIRKTPPLFKKIKLHLATHHDDNRAGSSSSFSLIHPPSSMQNVLEEFRQGKINVLMATSVVEEGVDIENCSFVAAFDSITCSKSYVQMKGRARQNNSKFLAFVSKEQTNILDEFANKEKALHEYLLTDRPGRTSSSSPIEDALLDGSLSDDCVMPDNLTTEDTSSLSSELLAVKRGYYEGPKAWLPLQAAGRHLNRYCVAQPIDPAARLSKDSLLAYMPSYNETCTAIYLPAYIASRSNREVILPDEYHLCSMKQKKSILAMMACVRLHEWGLLSDRLLPLSKESVLPRLTAMVSEEIRHDLEDGTEGAETISTADTPCTTTSAGGLLSSQSLLIPRVSEMVPEEISHDLGFDTPSTQVELSDTTAGDVVSVVSVGNELKTVYVYRIIQQSETLPLFERTLGAENVFLAIVSASPLPDVTDFSQHHRDFGRLVWTLDPVKEVICSVEQLGILSDFFSLLFNARWKRKMKEAAFRFRAVEKESDCGVPSYRVVCVDSEGDFLWDRMDRALSDSRRSTDGRRRAVLHIPVREHLSVPRLWSPSYNEHTFYIVFGPSSERCNAPFPYSGDNGAQIMTYAQYYKEEKGVDVPNGSFLFQAQRLWHLPSRRGHEGLVNEKVKYAVIVDGLRLCNGLFPIKLPQHACVEPSFADAGLYLLSTCLPQFLYHMERCIAAHSLMKITSEKLPKLSAFLRELPLADVVSVLSAKSCEEDRTYERLEWLGDAVLKLVQTDSIVKSVDLRPWVRHMNEGNLDLVRSKLGSNKCLARKCKRLGIDRYILTAPLARGQWTPAPLELFPSDVAAPTADGKICADVVEALLGLAYLHGNYDLALAVADEVQATLPWDNNGSRAEANLLANERLLSSVEQLTNYRFSDRHEIILEAFTHPTAQNPDTPSYQQLEWIGDAVLCLAAREWIFKAYPKADVKVMVLLETALVTNETLAFLSAQSDLHEHLIFHDFSLKGRLDSYRRTILDLGRGLWATNPPKAIADIVEAVLGAVHIHGGFHHGQQAVLKVLEPVLEMLKSLDDESTERLLKHPRKTILELGDKLLTVSFDREDVFAGKFPDSLIWCHNVLESAQRGGHRAVASVECLGELIVSVADETPSSAVNRACAFVLAVLEQDKSLLRRFHETRFQVVNRRTMICMEKS